MCDDGYYYYYFFVGDAKRNIGRDFPDVQTCPPPSMADFKGRPDKCGNCNGAHLESALDRGRIVLLENMSLNASSGSSRNTEFVLSSNLKVMPDNLKYI